MQSRSLALLPFLLLANVAPAFADAPSADRQSTTAIRQAVESHLQREIRGLPGNTSYEIGGIDPRLSLAACPALETFAAPGARPWGNTSVGVRCNGPAWSIFVPAIVRVLGDYVVTARPLSQGQTLEAQDVMTQRGDLGQLPAGVLSEPGAAVGKKISVSMAAGQPLRHDVLRAPTVIQQGQPVKITAQGNGFRVSSDGKALADARDGQVVLVRVASGQVISGIARSGGMVEAQSGR